MLWIVLDVYKKKPMLILTRVCLALANAFYNVISSALQRRNDTILTSAFLGTISKRTVKKLRIDCLQ